mmetsp:Transcript_14528/g.36893  ORF Transcript_14528/g.36893 Transcript_14528/m.36893 type:complete len:92 (-) Transcript_14528:413-688(-)
MVVDAVRVRKHTYAATKESQMVARALWGALSPFSALAGGRRRRPPELAASRRAVSCSGACCSVAHVTCERPRVLPSELPMENVPRAQADRN